MRSSDINLHGPGFDPAGCVSILPQGCADRQDISIFWHSSTRVWQRWSYLSVNLPSSSFRLTNCSAHFHNLVSSRSNSTTPEIIDTRRCMSYRWRQLCPGGGGGATSRKIDWSLPTFRVNLQHIKSLWNDLKFVSTLNAVAFYIIIIPRDFSRWLPIWHVFHLPLL